jgi:hypothetical protein
MCNSILALFFMDNYTPTGKEKGSPNPDEIQQITEFVERMIPGSVDNAHPHQNAEDRQVGANPHSDLVRK